MINNSEFAGRLTEIMDYYQLSASAFSDRIQVPRSSISHLLSGRNKPSLDFVLKVVKEFNEVELYWLLNGKGTFPSGPPSTSVKVDPFEEDSRNMPVKGRVDKNSPGASTEKELERIVFFYTDGSFREYRS